MTPDTPRPGFSTRAIHAGQDADPTTGGAHGRAHLRHHHLHPGGACSASTRATNTRRQRQPHARRPRNLPRHALKKANAANGFRLRLPRPRRPCWPRLRPGDEVVANADLYGGTYRLLGAAVFRPVGLVTRYTDDPSPAGFARVVTPKTKLVWIETPTNPLLQILDIAAIAEIAHKAGALLAVDNTFASPYLQQPLRLGADLVVHSTTKYLGGHSDVVGGAVVGRADLLKPIRFYQNAAGGVPGPFDSYLTLRGLKTLAIRMERHCGNARRLAAWLAEQPQVELIYYPGPARPPRPRTGESGRSARFRRHD